MRASLVAVIAVAASIVSSCDSSNDAPTPTPPVEQTALSLPPASSPSIPPSSPAVEHCSAAVIGYSEDMIVLDARRTNRGAEIDAQRSLVPTSVGNLPTTSSEPPLNDNAYLCWAFEVAVMDFFWTDDRAVLHWICSYDAPESLTDFHGTIACSA